ncbi:pyruvate dehydrogenase (acetyl-transferring), homodimeric type [Saccharomonospora iraqiensis]|uniref:pyruvate dehydrogenase (acetyl-transferring), homodimeric type n=1 Tax=Saccharomonospora iraqiensis TaxID=52698 RepID=UPI00022E7548|nr:pyruvate dehydrogenase (acetyl-transferring), homodimeric type [Saccharomonospora iraqiensis]
MTLTPDRADTPYPVLSDGLPSQLPDVDPAQTRDWVDALRTVVETEGPHRARFLLLRMLEQARGLQLGVPALSTTDYVNTIPTEREPWFPGDEALERRIRRIIRWNTAVMVTRANRPEIGVGGHIATYQSAAALYEVGFNHFFRGRDHPGGGDQVFLQGHASPGIYARAHLEGRFDEQRLDGFRQELSRGGARRSLSSYPHPRLMPDFWEFPTVSMGLGPINAIYQARFNRYLHARGIADTSGQRVWAFLGDGEMDEPESLGPIGLAAREELDNLIFVVNCNLQRLDGPVRGNGKVMQELESFFRGAGWNVVKVVWGREWDKLLAADRDGVLVEAMNTTPDGQFQTYATESGAYIRDHFFGRDPRLRALAGHLTDTELERLPRGGHDYRKIFAAYRAATGHTGQPTVVLAHTVKGWTLPHSMASRMANHQMKKMTADDLKVFRDRLELPITDEAIDAGTDRGLPPYYHPGADSEEVRYLLDRRAELGGFVPERRRTDPPLPQPPDKTWAGLRTGSGDTPVATTMAFVRLLKELMRDSGIGHRIVPIVPDEGRTFGMDSLFTNARVYSPHGQTYESVDRALLLSWKEAEAGQILHEGISEAGSMASATAAGTAYATHGEPMIPVYLFYSMFGFQRTGDAAWAFSDQMAKGFLLGATAGRTTLNGEGLQHEDGHSLLLASTNPACVAYDPAFAYEVAHIVRDGLRRMYGEASEDIWYYLTVYNEPYPQPPEPDGLDVDGLLRGLYRYAPRPDVSADAPAARILASGVAVPWALRARELLADEWGVAAEMWSAPSWTELRREALACDGHNRAHPEQAPRQPHVTTALAGDDAPVVAVSDWMRAVPDQIRPWVPARYTSLGTDGFGCSDTRFALRRHFGVDAESIVAATLGELVATGAVEPRVLREARRRYRLDEPGFYPGGLSAGGDA